MEKPIDHALKLSHPMPFHVMHTDGKRISKKKKGFALVGLVFEIVCIHGEILVENAGGVNPPFK